MKMRVHGPPHTHTQRRKQRNTKEKQGNLFAKFKQHLVFLFFLALVVPSPYVPSYVKKRVPPPTLQTYIYLNFHFQPSATKLTAFFLWRMCHKINKYRDGLCRRVSPDIWTVGPISNGYSINLQSLLHPIPHQPSSPTPRYMLQCC